MTKIEVEIRKNRILSYTEVRAGTNYRCLKDVCGKPAMQWALEAVKRCKYIDKMVVVTEDKKIGRLVEDLGITVIDQPLYLTFGFPRDYTAGTFRKDNPRSLRSEIPEIFLNTTKYALWWLEEKEGYKPDLVMRTCIDYIMVTTELANRIIEDFFKDKEATEAGSFAPGPTRIYIDNAKTGRPFPILFEAGHDRQIYPNIWMLGPLHLFGLASYPISYGRHIAPVYVTEEEALDAHTEEDLFKARCYMKRRLLREGKEVKWEIGQDDK